MSVTRCLLLLGLLSLTTGCMTGGLWQTEKVDFRRTGELKITDKAVCDEGIILGSRNGKYVTVLTNHHESMNSLDCKLMQAINWDGEHYQPDRISYAFVDFTRCPSNLYWSGHVGLMFEEHDGLSNQAHWTTNGIDTVSFVSIEQSGAIPIYECFDNRDGFWRRTGRIALTPFAVALDVALSPFELIGAGAWIWICATTPNMFR